MSTDRRVERAKRVKTRLSSQYGQEMLNEPRPIFGLEFDTGVREIDEDGGGVVGACVVDTPKMVMAFLSLFVPSHVETARLLDEGGMSGEEVAEWSERAAAEGVHRRDQDYFRAHRAITYFLTFAPEKLSGAVTSLFEEARAWAIKDVDGDEQGASAMLDSALGVERKAAVDRLMLHDRGRRPVVDRALVGRALLWLYDNKRDLTQANVVELLNPEERDEPEDGGPRVEVTERTLSAWARPIGILYGMDGWEAHVAEFRAEMAHRERLRAEQRTPVDAGGSDLEQ